MVQQKVILLNILRRVILMSMTESITQRQVIKKSTKPNVNTSIMIM